MAEGEGVEGAWEESHLVTDMEGKGAILDMVVNDETVDMAESGGGIEEGQLLFRLFPDQEQDLFCQQQKKAHLILV